MVEARQHPVEHTPSARLERLLEEAGTRWWVVNAGVGATGTNNQLHPLRYVGPHYQPLLGILVLFTGTDFQNNPLPSRPSTRR
jgi:hypothetical protein